MDIRLHDVLTMLIKVNNFFSSLLAYFCFSIILYFLFSWRFIHFHSFSHRSYAL